MAIEKEEVSINFKPDKLLVIEMDNASSIPRVIYKGKEITNRINVNFKWETDTDELGGMELSIKYAEKEELTTDEVTVRHGKYAFNEYKEDVIVADDDEVLRNISAHVDSQVIIYEK